MMPPVIYDLLRQQLGVGRGILVEEILPYIRFNYARPRLLVVNIENNSKLAVKCSASISVVTDIISELK